MEQQGISPLVCAPRWGLLVSGRENVVLKLAGVALLRSARLVVTTPLGAIGCDQSRKNARGWPFGYFKLIAGCHMAPGGNEVSRCNGEGRANALPAGYVPPGGVRVDLDDPLPPGATPPIPPVETRLPSGAPASESLKAEVETLCSRL